MESIDTTDAAIVGVSDALLAALRDPAFYPHQADRVDTLETHISWIFLAGEFAYKLKKPVRFGLVDFSTPARRQHFCARELELNQRFAPRIYIDVVSFGQTGGRPVWGGSPAIEMAVRMHRFPETARLDHIQERRELGASQIDAFASRIAEIHRLAPAADTATRFGSAAILRDILAVNLTTLRAALGQSSLSRVETLTRWSEDNCARFAPLIESRRLHGAVRECHGDLHLANMVWFDNEPMLFDCIEFDDSLRWIDRLNDIAFLLMDLESRGEFHLASRFLDRYLVATGDYAGVPLLPLFKHYRALVRASVNAFRLHQSGLSAVERDNDRELVQRYLALAETYMQRSAPRLILMHGLPGSGKTTRAAEMAPGIAAICLHSDVERKRLAGLSATERSLSPIDGGIYTQAATDDTYARLLELARDLLIAGQSVIVDAAFSQRHQRALFIDLAQACGAQASIVSLDVALEELRARVARREHQSGQYSEAGLTVLERAIARQEPLDDKERKLVVSE